MRAIFHHRVVTTSDPGDAYAGTAVAASVLEAQAAELARNWRVLSLAEVHDHLSSGRRLPARAVHLSFDDGYADNLVAAEILERHRLPWTLFVVADAVLDGFVPWYVRLAGALGASTSNPPGGVARFKGTAKEAVMAAPAARHLEVLDDVLAAAGLRVPEAPVWPFLSVDQLRDLAGRGVEIGNHSATHPNLVRCTVRELAREVGGSQARLAAALGQPVRTFSYPDGRWDRTVLAATAATHDLAMATWTESRPLAPTRLRRFPAGASVGDLHEVLAPGHPTRHRALRAKWAVRRAVRPQRWSRPAST